MKCIFYYDVIRAEKEVFAMMYTVLLGMALAQTKSSGNVTIDDVKYVSSNVVDGRLDTGWADGAVNNGVGTWIELDMKRSSDIETLSIWPSSFLKGKRNWNQYSRPKVIQLYIDGKAFQEPIRLLDQPGPVHLKVGSSGRKIRIEIQESYEGVVYKELVISEIAINFFTEDSKNLLKRWEGYQVSKEAKKYQEKSDEEIEKLFFTYQDNDGDSESLRRLMEIAGEGSDWKRRKVVSYVPEGYRLQAIEPDPKALEALRKLRDSNAIPALENAAYRSDGFLYKKLMRDAEYYYALRELTGGVNRNVPAWGQSGWSNGEMQGFGEPLAIEVNPFLQVMVVDTGNHRVSFYNENGLMKSVWGGSEPAITDKWLSGGRPWYVSGATPKYEGNGLSSPLDLVVVPKKVKKEVTFESYVLNGDGSIVHLNAEGQLLSRGDTNPSFGAVDGMGGTGYLAHISKKKTICAIVQSEGICLKERKRTEEDVGIETELVFEEVSRFTVSSSDGLPSAVEVVKGSKMYISFVNQVVHYSFDGFRNKVVVSKDVLGSNFEYMDLTIDDNGKLWLLTDASDLYQFTASGKLIEKMHIERFSLQHPRIAMHDEMLYVSSEDQIRTYDIKQMRLDSQK
jgi:hypothetical protein